MPFINIPSHATSQQMHACVCVCVCVYVCVSQKGMPLINIPSHASSTCG
jgi:hypothetical protein